MSLLCKCQNLFSHNAGCSTTLILCIGAMLNDIIAIKSNANDKGRIVANGQQKKKNQNTDWSVLNAMREKVHLITFNLFVNGTQLSGWIFKRNFGFGRCSIWRARLLLFWENNENLYSLASNAMFCIQISDIKKEYLLILQ